MCSANDWKISDVEEEIDAQLTLEIIKEHIKQIAEAATDPETPDA